MSWSEVKTFLRSKGVYCRHMLQKPKLSTFGGCSASVFAQRVRGNGGDGPREVLATFRRIFG